MEIVVKPVKEEEKQSWQSVAFIWIGASLSMSAIVSGTAIAQTNNFINSMIASIIGYGIIILISFLQAMQGVDTGLSTTFITRKIFGERGSRLLLSAIIAIALIGWFGIQGGVAGGAMQQYFSDLGIEIPLYIWTILAGVLMTLTAMFGIKSMKYLNYIAVPFMIIILGWAFVAAFLEYDFSVLLDYTPVSSTSILETISAITGGFIVGAVIASDYTRYNKNRKDTLKSCFFGIVPVGIFLKVLGVSLAIFVFSTSTNSEIDVYGIISTYVPSPLLVFVMILLASWTTNVGNAYSGGLAVSNALNLKEDYHKYAILFSGIVGTLLAVIGILDNIIEFLSFLTALVAPVGGVMIANYWICNKGNVETYNNSTPNVLIAFFSWLIGCLPFLIIKFANLFTSNDDILGVLANLAVYTSLLGILMSVGLYVILYKYNKESNGKNKV